MAHPVSATAAGAEAPPAYVRVLTGMQQQQPSESLQPPAPPPATRLRQCFFVKEYFPVAINVKTGMPPFGILANHKIKMCHNSMKKIMIGGLQKITQNNWNF